MSKSQMPVVVTFYLSKGGVAKSTLAALTGSYLAARGFRVAIVDLDRQGSQSEIFDLIDTAQPPDEDPSLVGQENSASETKDGNTGRPGEVLHLVFKRRLDILAAMTPVHHHIPVLPGYTPGELYVLQGGPQTKEAIDEINASPVRFKIANTLDIVRGPLEDLAGYIDFVIMDMGPSDQVAALAGLVASDLLVIPTMTDYLSVSRIAPVIEEVEVARQVKPELSILGIVTVMSRYYFGRLRKSKNVQVGEDFLLKTYGDLLLRDDKNDPVDIPYAEEWRNVMWAGENLLASSDVSKKVKDDAMKFLTAVASQLGLGQEVSHG